MTLKPSIRYTAVHLKASMGVRVGKRGRRGEASGREPEWSGV